MRRRFGRLVAAAHREAVSPSCHLCCRAAPFQNQVEPHEGWFCRLERAGRDPAEEPASFLSKRPPLPFRR